MVSYANKPEPVIHDKDFLSSKTCWTFLVPLCSFTLIWPHGQHRDKRDKLNPSDVRFACKAKLSVKCERFHLVRSHTLGPLSCSDAIQGIILFLAATEGLSSWLIRTPIPGLWSGHFQRKYHMARPICGFKLSTTVKNIYLSVSPSLCWYFLISAQLYKENCWFILFSFCLQDERV